MTPTPAPEEISDERPTLDEQIQFVRNDIALSSPQFADLPVLRAILASLLHLRQGAVSPSSWVSEQYHKIQDFVIARRLYIDQPDNLSHADIVLALAEKQLAQQSLPQPEQAATGGGVVVPDVDTLAQIIRRVDGKHSL